MVHSGFIA
jgi:hypothetical protein